MIGMGRRTGLQAKEERKTSPGDPQAHKLGQTAILCKKNEI
jgi:hypothetical protein